MTQASISLPCATVLRACLLAVALHLVAVWWLVQPVLGMAQEKVVSFSLTLAPVAASARAVVREEIAPEEKPVAAQAAPVAQRKSVALPKAQVSWQAVKVKEAALPAVARQAVVAPVTQARFDAAYLHNPAPQYPALSRRMGEEGTVLLHVLVSAQGSAGEVALKSSSGYERLDEAAVKAVRGWRFVPADAGGQMVASWVDVPVSFHLEAL